MSATLLIIDDDKELCSLLCDFLSLEGFSPSAVHDGAEAVAHCGNTAAKSLHTTRAQA